MLTSGILSLSASKYPGISLGGLAARLTVVALALTIALSSPTVRVVKLWTFAALAGTSIMCAAGLFFFLKDVSVPLDISSLPGLRVLPGIGEYQKATYGFSSNTVDLLVMTAPIALALALAVNATRWERAFCVIALAFMTANLLIDFERWGWVCIGLAVALIAAFYRRRPIAKVIAATSAVAVLFVGFTSHQGIALVRYFFGAIQPGTGSSLFDRVHYWSQGLTAIAHQPLGYGLGMAGSVPALTETSSHNLFIDIGVEGGLVAIAGAVVWTIYHVSRFVVIVRRGAVEDEMAFALLLGPLCFVVFGIFFNSLLYFSGLMVWLAFWWCFPVMAGALLTKPRSASETFRRS